MKHSVVRLMVVALVAATMSTIGTSTAGAASNCAPVDLGKQAIGTVRVGKTMVDLERVTYPAGGDLFPPADARIAGVSARHQPLSAKVGSTIIVWHDFWDGCAGPLNTLMKKKLGFQFSVTDGKGVTRKYEIVEKSTIKMGNYQKSWFALNGPRQLVMFTCTGELVNGHKVLNEVVRAVPVR